MPDSLTRLERADPIAYLDAPHHAPPPADVLERIVATPLPRRRRWTRPAVGAVAVAAAAAAALAFLPSSGGKVDLAARAYAATAPEDDVIYTVITSENDSPRFQQRTRLTLWQRGDRMHNIEEVVQTGVNPGEWRYEHDQKDGVFRTLLRGKVDAIRIDDPGWKGEEGRQGFALNLLTVVDRFRARFAEHKMRDDGETTFAGRKVHAYTVLDPETPGVRETFYLDPETSLPVGDVHVLPIVADVDPKTRRPVPGAKPVSVMRITEVVERYERLAPTPENLKLLDAPAIDAAQR
jgi:hypothetical protein